ncbi:glycoside hydrolase family 2 TIM barrel-domain containing protein [Saccharibacillus sp. CPCC 101409]|uniref:glycoside hydrolase family 2 TIM barrel-domain containing protein n=1 Tax=Saccharibacillus sp. CPCC 101409 TaxID=3058041 RepID=UPI002671437B|nr:glycoside hydrolase family 2 TIM barrel-domain containing protein [Saccharibacillus sp. CPCC 101409]MDO3410121.1 glycoside hydrolase family 2 TIM barrel-domain containing protein [Saccharibacillus sp. CPCC 101409]
MNTTVLFNDGWTFAKSGLEQTDWRGLDFAPVEIPHDWLIGDTRNLYENGIGWYRRTLETSVAAQGGAVLLRFDGVYMDSSVYVNGTLVGEWKYGYSTFEFDITSALTDEANEIVVKVVYRSPNSRWYSGAGIYRNVYLKTRGASYIESDGIYVTTARGENGWNLEIDTETAAGEESVLTHTLLDGETVLASVSAGIAADRREETDQANAARKTTDRQTLHIEPPRLWSPDEPNLYRLVTELRSAATGEVTETVVQNTGFREFELHPEHGFSLNGRRMKLNGVCEHHDLGALGSAFNAAAQRRRFKQLKEMGVNAIRTAHNMPAPEVMDLADEMGLLVVSEAFDMWERPKTTYDYARFFREWAPADVRSWVRRDRNRPSLLLWSIGNEIYDTHADESGQEITRMLIDEVRRHDPRGNARVTIGSNYMPWENAQKCADIVKVAGYNYAEKYYRKHHEEHPDWIIYGSETSSVVQSRGIYHFPLERPILTDDDRQCSALGNSPTSWGAKSVEACLLAERDAPFSLGQFLWTGFDYIGEPTPYHTKNSYFGQIDTAGFPKDSYYMYQAGWTDYQTAPMVHILPYWDFNDGQTIDVRVCSNAPRIELRLDGESLGFHDTDWASGTQPFGHWKLPYRAGRLTAIAYGEDGRIVAEDVRESFGDARRIVLRADRSSLGADGRDVIFVEIGAEDEHGRSVGNAANRVRVQVSGAGRLLGMDNGDSTDYDAYKGASRRLFSGKALAIVGATTEAGAITVSVSSPGLEGAELTLEALAAGEAGGAGAGKTREAEPAAPERAGVSDADGTDGGTSPGSGAKASAGGLGEPGEAARAGGGPRQALPRCEDAPIVTGSGGADEIPLRRIGIVSAAGRALTAASPSAAVRAELFPADASYRDVEWSVTDDAGIASHLARVEADGLDAVVTALGDGIFRLRCASRSGTDGIRLISQLEFEASGLGTAYHDPYGFVSAGVYDYSRGDVGTGNERGVATSRDGETVVGFTRLDFGPYGSDTITLPIFALSGEEYPIAILAGIPGEDDSEPLADVVYQKPSIWNTYQEETYKLARRLRGVETLCFVLNQKVHIKGFSFERQSRAFAFNRAADCDRIYGDAFERGERGIEEIGNNVSLEFDDMDFGAAGTDVLTLLGRSPIDRNTIQIRFENADGEFRRLIEFAKSDSSDYEERAFPLERIAGRYKVTFIFLPGSRFDFGGFRFGRSGSV